MAEIRKENSFELLNVKQQIVEALREQGIEKPTTIQEKAIPAIHDGKDLIGISRTGSGKTAAFGIPMLEMVTKGDGIQGLVLAPTRELANQISKEMRKWAKYLDLSIATVFGGVGFDPQVRLIEKSEIVVGTPGRTLDHLMRGTLKLKNLKCFALDEADKMVEMGFIEDVEQILSASNDSRQILLFGATISNEIDHIKQKYMKDTVVAEAELHVKKDLLEQFYYNVPMNEKFSLLVHLLKKENTDRVIIFCSKRSTVELIYKNLRLHKIKAEMIHGKMTQTKRLSVIDRFNSEKASILVASAVAARGLDIKNVTHVFNYDLSQDPQEYIHRVGRTARAGEQGRAFTLLSHQDFDSFESILRRYVLDVVELPLEKFEKIRFETRSYGGNDGPRNNRGYNNGGQRSNHRSNYRSGGDTQGRNKSYGQRRDHNKENLADKYGMTENSSRKDYRKD